MAGALPEYYGVAIIVNEDIFQNLFDKNIINQILFGENTNKLSFDGRYYAFLLRYGQLYIDSSRNKGYSPLKITDVGLNIQPIYNIYIFSEKFIIDETSKGFLKGFFGNYFSIPNYIGYINVDISLNPAKPYIFEYLFYGLHSNGGNTNLSPPVMVNPIESVNSSPTIIIDTKSAQTTTTINASPSPPFNNLEDQTSPTLSSNSPPPFDIPPSPTLSSNPPPSFSTPSSNPPPPSNSTPSFSTPPSNSTPSFSTPPSSNSSSNSTDIKATDIILYAIGAIFVIFAYPIMNYRFKKYEKEHWAERGIIWKKYSSPAKQLAWAEDNPDPKFYPSYFIVTIILIIIGLIICLLPLILKEANVKYFAGTSNVDYLNIIVEFYKLKYPNGGYINRAFNIP